MIGMERNAMLQEMQRGFTILHQPSKSIAVCLQALTTTGRAGLQKSDIDRRLT
ncbi:MAG: hypothetical protein AB8B58_20095 [Roseobacter sp.]